MVAPESGRDSGGGAAASQGVEGVTAEEEAFVRGLLARGEAARAVDGKLPPGATHEIVEERPGQLPKIVRRRFS